MKKYTTEAVLERAREKIVTKYGYDFLKDSAIQIELEGHSELISDLARYVEFIALENSHTHARNITSHKYMSSLVGYKLRRKTSSRGVVYVSNTTGVRQIIDKHTQIFVNDIPYTILEDYIINATDVDIPIRVIQGELKSIEFTTDYTGLLPFEFYKADLDVINVEDARTDVSKDLLEVREITGVDTFRVWNNVDSIRQAESYNRGYEVFTTDDFKVRLIFGNKLSGFLPPENTTFEFQYLETAGSKGEVLTKVADIKHIDAGLNTHLSFSLKSFLSGGRDEDTLEDIKYSAPIEYKKQLSVGSKPSFIGAIEEIPNVSKANVWGEEFVKDTFPEILEDILNPNHPFFKVYDVTLVTAISDEGELFTKEDIFASIQSELENRVHPSDKLSFIPTIPIDFRVNTLIEVGNRDFSLTKVQATEKLLGDSTNKGTIHILSREYKEKLHESQIVNDLMSISGVQNPSVSLEVVKDLPSANLRNLEDNLRLREGIDVLDSECLFRDFKDNTLYTLRLDIVGKDWIKVIFLIEESVGHNCLEVVLPRTEGFFSEPTDNYSFEKILSEVVSNTYKYPARMNFYSIDFEPKTGVLKVSAEDIGVINWVSGVEKEGMEIESVYASARIDSKEILPNQDYSYLIVRPHSQSGLVINEG